MASSLPLEGVRILDLTRLLPGPYATMLLADLGAEVIKVEEPQRGDYAREIGPFVEGIGCWYLMFNRNKRSLAVDLKAPRGREILYRLVESSHVVIEGFRPGTVKRLHVDYKTLRKHNKGLVYCSLSGYGQEGRYSSWVGHDLNYIGVSGLLDMTRTAGGTLAVPGLPVADLAGGLLAAFLICVALRESESTGVGRYLDVSMADLISSWSIYNLLPFLATGEAPKGGATFSTGRYPCYSIYETSDGKFLTLGATEEKFWKAFCHEAGLPDLEAYHVPEGDMLKEVEARTRETLRKRPLDEWLQRLAERGVPVAPVNGPADLMEDPGIHDRGIFWSLRDRGYGPVVQSRFSVAYTEDLGERSTPPPHLGEHTQGILQGLGISQAEIRDLAEKGIVALPRPPS